MSDLRVYVHCLNSACMCTCIYTDVLVLAQLYKKVLLRFLDPLLAVSFLVTASDPTYVVVMNGSLPESSRNLSGVGLDGIIVTNGTPCMTTVSLLCLTYVYYN